MAGRVTIPRLSAPDDNMGGRGRLPAHYASLNRIDPTPWLLLTSARAEIERLARAILVELSDTTGNGQGLLQYTETLVLVDRLGHIRGVYSGSVAFEAAELIADVRQLLVERTE